MLDDVIAGFLESVNEREFGSPVELGVMRVPQRPREQGFRR